MAEPVPAFTKAIISAPSATTSIPKAIDAAQSLNQEEIVERCIIQMLNEAARCLEEGIIASPQDGDIGAIFGIGFPPFLGGPFRYMDSYGIENLVERLQSYQLRFGSRFEPAQILLDYEAQGKSFYSDNA